MLYHLLSPYASKWIGFNLFRYITFRAFMGAVTAFVITVVVMPVFIRWAKKHGHRERISEDVPEIHEKKEGTPTSGGIVFVSSVIFSVLLWARWDTLFTWAALIAISWTLLIGFIDDMMKFRGEKKKGMSKKMKLTLQFILSLVIFGFVYKIYGEFAVDTQTLFFKNLFISLGWFYPIFMVFVFLGATNAVNLTDGLDGLAAGAALAPLGVLMVVAYIQGHAVLSKYLNLIFAPGSGELSIVAATFIGSLLGFLWYNAHPAEVFMGDSGSQGLGGCLAILAILTKQELLLAVAGGLFVIEALSVIIQVISYKRWGKRVFLIAPIHHHFEKLGWAENKIVVRFWVLSMVFSIIAIATLKIR